MRQNPYSSALLAIGAGGLLIGLLLTILSGGALMSPLAAFGGWLGSIGAVGLIAALMVEARAWQTRKDATSAVEAQGPTTEGEATPE